MKTDDSIENVLESLSNEEKIVLKYFIRYRSVGELLALRELKALYGVQEPIKVIGKLIEKRLIVKGIGCYSISQEVLKKLSTRLKV